MTTALRLARAVSLSVLLVASIAGVAFASPAPPAVRSAAAIVVDARTGAVLFEKNARERRPIASLTKVMTALIAVEEVGDWNEAVVADDASCAAGESEIYLTPGERIRLRDLLAAVLLKSANDASSLLARAVAGRPDLFVAMMNARARELGMTDTEFRNPHGLYHPRHRSSARDCAIMAREAIRHERLRELFRTKETTIPWPGHPGGRHLVNHNKLLFRDPAVRGVKTGYVRQSGHCLISYGVYEGREVIAVVLGAPDPQTCYAESAALLAYGRSRYTTVTVVRAGEVVATVRRGWPFRVERRVRALSDVAVVVPASLAGSIQRDVEMLSSDRARALGSDAIVRATLDGDVLATGHAAIDAGGDTEAETRPRPAGTSRRAHREEGFVVRFVRYLLSLI